MKENYAVWFDDDTEKVVKMTEEQAKAINWVFDTLAIAGRAEKANDYKGDEI